MKTKVLIVDDHVIVREGLRQLLNSHSDMEIVGEAGDGKEALGKAKQLFPDVILLDLALPEMGGLVAISQIKDALPDCEVVILSMHDKEIYIHQALSSGALGYVLKTSPSSEVIEAIRASRRKEYFLSSSLNAEVIAVYIKNRGKKSIQSEYDLLTEREQQVFRLIVEGNTTKQIASTLCLSPKTIEKYRTNVSKKLGLNNIVNMVKYAIRIGVVDSTL